MAQTFTGRKRVRKYFGHIREITEMPNLIEIQKASYEQFLLVDEPKGGRPDEGLQSVFKSVFPISDFSGASLLEFVKYEFEAPKFDVDECRQRGMTFSAPLKVTLRLIVFDIDPDTGAKSVKDIKEQDVYMGDMPFMTMNGTFIVNGTERVIVSQMHRSPGVFFDHDKGKSHSSGKLLFAARIIPYRGSWLDIEFDAKDIVYARIDRRRKIPVTSLLFALGMDGEEILSTFFNKITYTRDGDHWRMPFDGDRLKGVKLTQDMIDADTGDVVVETGRKLTVRAARQLIENGLKAVRVNDEDLIGHYLAEDIYNQETGEIYAEAGEEITAKSLPLLLEHGFSELPLLDIDHITIGPYIRNTLSVDKNSSREEALFDIYRVMRPGEPPTIESGEAMFRSLFFDPERYDLSAVGRVKMNMRLDLVAPDTMRVLRKDDIVAVVRALVDLRDGRGEIDDIDHLGNRRVRSVGELMENQYRVGLLRMERAIKERMSSVDIDTVMPQDLINAKPAAAAVREFFGSSQLSQFMDQTNPLSEITHKRRLSALGPGGLTRERAGFEVRDVHPTHYGRICPIETPEGPNIGLINSLATFARVNKYGFIEAPYRRFRDGKVTNEVMYLSAMEEAKYHVAQANIILDADGSVSEDLVVVRHAGDVMMVPRDRVEYMDVSAKQLVSVAAALIPFLENDDANRALMGSNMQRQAVPLVKADAPLVGTGMEAVVARDSGAAIAARRTGVVDQIDATRIVVRATEDMEAGRAGVDIYRLMKYQRSNQSTCINQKPLVRVGDRVRKGDIIADGPSTDLGDLALGRNVLVAFMPWNGYNFEDSILLNDLKSVRDALRFGKSLSWSPVDIEKLSAAPPRPAPPAETPRPKAAPKPKPAPPAFEPVAEVAASSQVLPMPTHQRVREQDDRVSLYIKIPLLFVTGVILVSLIIFGGIWSSSWVQPKPVPAPQMIGRPIDDVRADAQKLGVKLIEHHEFNAKPRKVVYKADKELGTQVRKGSFINVWYSDGPEYVNVPKVKGLNRDDAEKKIQDAGLALGKVTTKNSETVPQSCVISQSGQVRALHDTPIDLVISDGPTVEAGQEPIPAPTPDPAAAPSATVPETGPNPGPAPDETPHDFNRRILIQKDGLGTRLVRIEYDDTVGTHVPISENHAEGDHIAVQFTYYGKSAKMRIYYNDELKKSLTVKP